MINSRDFSKRLEKVIDFYGETASSFAEKIGVQRSSISHILSGRNKPSLDFVMKVLSSYPEVELYWLLNGKGNFPKMVEPTISKNESSEHQNSFQKQITSDQDIERIVIFFKDGTFKNFTNF
ncbi:helix-turn-helix domain-containing protein [Hanstruepera ponticola]|uniref:helix-turn-helix domain-containing protein n=1 Tax=Hanstruepera ponticola TaxID=2042995 RepID=UPI00177B762B|nr:helix-turn-helix transcriptional regulator [Hanstruepera ponticola]